MRVFVSWSGELSHSVALILREWLPKVLPEPDIDIFVSSGDIDRGSRWFEEVLKALEDSDVGIVCLTRSNINKPWIHFESGAIAKELKRSFVCTLLIDLAASELRDPLKQFMATLPEKKDLLKLLRTINRQLGQASLDDTLLEESFEKHWPEFRADFRKALAKSQKSQVFRGKVLVVFAGKENLVPHFDQNLFLHAGALHYISKFSELFSRLSVTEVKYEVHTKILPDEVFDVEVCMGSPGWNPRTKFYIDEYCSKLYDSEGKTVNEREAVIIKLRIPVSGSKRYRIVFLIYGDQSIDTYACVDYFTQEYDFLTANYLYKDIVVLRYKVKVGGENVRYVVFYRDESRDVCSVP